MLIQVNTDNNIHGGEALTERVRNVVESTLGLFSNQITRVEVHLSDENSEKGGQYDHRCLMEVRLEGRRPVAVSHRAPTVGEALDGASEKLARMLDSTLGRLRDQKMQRPSPPIPPAGDPTA